MGDGNTLVMFGILLIIMGFFLVLAGFMLKVGKSVEPGKVEVGGVLVIGPIPIIFGNSKTAILLAVLGALLLILLIIMYRKILYTI